MFWVQLIFRVLSLWVAASSRLIGWFGAKFIHETLKTLW